MAEAAGAVHRFPCDGCGAEVAWDPAARGLRCPFCATVRPVDLERSDVERDLPAALAGERERGAADEEEPSRAVECERCGATVELPDQAASVRCPWCGSERVVEQAAEDDRLRPDTVVPFAVAREAALDAFRDWLKGLWFRPTALKKQYRLAELRGVYVPFWTFDAFARSEWTAMAGYYYTVTVPTKNGVRTETRIRWQPASGRRSDEYDDHLECASRGVDAGLVRKIEPFALADLVPWTREPLAGFAVERWAVDLDAGWRRAQVRIRSSQESLCASDVPGDTHTGLSVDTTIEGRRYRHCLLPVWVASYQWRGKVHRFLVNGQTGEVQGEAPYSWIKITLAVLGVAAVIAAIVLIAQYA